MERQQINSFALNSSDEKEKTGTFNVSAINVGSHLQSTAPYSQFYADASLRESNLSNLIAPFNEEDFNQGKFDCP